LAGQFKALKRDGYHFAREPGKPTGAAGGTPEESTRQSWADEKELQEAAAI